MAQTNAPAFSSRQPSRALSWRKEPWVSKSFKISFECDTGEEVLLCVALFVKQNQELLTRNKGLRVLHRQPACLTSWIRTASCHSEQVLVVLYSTHVYVYCCINELFQSSFAFFTAHPSFYSGMMVVPTSGCSDWLPW